MAPPFHRSLLLAGGLPLLPLLVPSISLIRGHPSTGADCDPAGGTNACPAGEEGDEAAAVQLRAARLPASPPKKKAPRGPTYPPKKTGRCTEGETWTTEPGPGGCQQVSCVSGELHKQCKVRMRKEINDVTDDEFARLAAAINLMSESGEWTRIATIHHASDQWAHRTPNFLPWHRKFLLDVETRLQQVSGDCSLTLPYWNWALEVSREPESVVWSDNRYGKTNGTVWDPQCLTTGPFNGSSAAGQRGRAKGFGEFCIRRAYGQRHYTQYDWMTLALELHSSDSQFQGVASYDAMRRMLEFDVHGYPHGKIGGRGGHMGAFYSPYDPIFFAHHGFIDMLWKRWQDQHVDLSKRYHREGDTFPATNISVAESKATYSATDFTVSMHALDDDPSTEIEERSCVDYADRRDSGACAKDGMTRISDCLSKAASADRLGEVPRVTGLRCQPDAPGIFDHARLWFDTMQAEGMFTKPEVEDIMARGIKEAKHLRDVLPHMADAENECDARVCFSVRALMAVCVEIEADAPVEFLSETNATGKTETA